jgi:hypothetical protein
VSLFCLQVDSGCLTGRHSNAFDEFHLRWRAGRPYEGTIDGPGFSSHPFIPVSLAICTTDILIRCVVRECQGGLQNANL